MGITEWGIRQWGITSYDLYSVVCFPWSVIRNNIVQKNKKSTKRLNGSIDFFFV